ncbi:MAG TPA: glycine cleavage system aminomethyltransferase GcvT [Candidatus Hydrogenedentes bacterium]|nr:glycine cleavage system aminomethyltransferase GcvT [Candidatus Hydrogenedentota bacterium]
MVVPLKSAIYGLIKPEITCGDEEMQKTALHDLHEKMGGKIVDFNGWALPVQFSGIVNEHIHTRTQASLFDCSHMGEYVVKGADAIEAYSREIISDLSKIPVGRCRYGAVLNDAAGILDDLITFRMSEDELYVVTNAGPLEQITDRFCSNNPGMTHVSYETAKIDIQGPMARECALKAGFGTAESLKYFNATWTHWEGHRILLSRTGYTGELGYELFMDNDLAETIWQRFYEMDCVELAGLGARDTLRTEVGYALSGQDFNDAITPLEANMAPFVDWDKDFVGKQALRELRESNDYPVLTPIKTNSRRSPRHNFEVHNEGRAVGIVTTGTFGPSVGHGIGYARIPQELSAPETALTAGPKNLEIETCTAPFYSDGTCRLKL